MDNNNNQKVYYEKVHIMHKPKDAPLKDAVFTVSGSVEHAELKSGPYGDFLSVKLTSVLSDGSVKKHFGEALVNPEHKVQFEFTLSGYNKDNFVKYTPRWGQTVIFTLYDMDVSSFPRRTGGTGYSVKAKCSGFAALGELKKADGSERPPIRISGVAAETEANHTPAARAQTPAPSPAEDLRRLGVDTFEENEELPF